MHGSRASRQSGGGKNCGGDEAPASSFGCPNGLNLVQKDISLKRLDVNSNASGHMLPAGAEQTANRAKRTQLRHFTSIRQYREQGWNCFRGPGAIEIQITCVEQTLRLDVPHRRQEGFFEVRIILFELAEQGP